MIFRLDLSDSSKKKKPLLFILQYCVCIKIHYIVTRNLKKSINIVSNGDELY